MSQVISLNEYKRTLSEEDYKIMEQLNLLGLYEDERFNCLISQMRTTHEWFLDGRLNRKQYSDFIKSLHRRSKTLQTQKPLQIKQ